MDRKHQREATVLVGTIQSYIYQVTEPMDRKLQKRQDIIFKHIRESTVTHFNFKQVEGMMEAPKYITIILNDRTDDQER